MKTIIVMLLFLSSCCPNYSNGSRAGIVTKLSERGLIFKSWEGEMLMALPSEIAGTTMPEKFYFNISPSVVNDVQWALKSGQRVELVYRQWMLAPPTIDNKYVVVKVAKTTK